MCILKLSLILLLYYILFREFNESSFGSLTSFGSVISFSGLSIVGRSGSVTGAGTGFQQQFFS